MSAVAAAAYRSGEKVRNEYDGLSHDYTKKGGVVHTETLLPENAPEDYENRSMLWNAVERIEKNKNAQLAREIEIALPKELGRQQQIELAHEYCRKFFVDAGMCADVCVHDKGDGNPHAHVMLTMRPFEKDGAWAAKSKKEYLLDENGERIRLKNGSFKTRKVNTTDWNDQSKAEEWRAGWADMVNEYLARQDVAERVDHRSYKRQGIDKIPTIHMGAAACQMEQRGIATERGNINRAIEVTNSELRQLRARIKKCKDWLYSQPLTGALSLVDTMKGIAGGKNLASQWKKIADLKTQAKVLAFLQENNITDIALFADKITQIYEQSHDISGKIKTIERRLSTLAEHLRQRENYKKHKAVFENYRQLDPKKRDDFYKKHGEKIELFKNAKHYLDAVMNGKNAIPLKAWQAEQAKLFAAKFSLCDDYYKLKDDVRSVEALRRSVETLMRENEPAQRIQKDKGMKL